MLDRPLRPIAGRMLAPVADRLTFLPPAGVTATALAVGLTAAAAAAVGAFGAALALWLANRLLDGVDGELARRTGRTSDRGALLDLMGDLTVYAALTLGVAAGAAGAFGGVVHADGAQVWPLAALLLAAYYVNLGSLAVLAALLEKRRPAGAERSDPNGMMMPAGLVEGTETIVLVSLMLLLPSHLPLVLAISAVLVAATAVQRVVWGASQLARP